jgi:hypothetical protein
VIECHEEGDMKDESDIFICKLEKGGSPPKIIIDT